jgi:molybdenum cofactor cytidylyltransferase
MPDAIRSSPCSRPASNLPAVRVVRNARPGAEQITSVRLGLAQLVGTPAIAALLWPVDHPFVALESVLAVLDAARRTSAPIVIPEMDGRRGHPALFHRDTWRELMTVEDGGARTVIRAYGDRVAGIAVRDAGVLRDIDTRADLDG